MQQIHCFLVKFAYKMCLLWPFWVINIIYFSNKICNFIKHFADNNRYCHTNSINKCNLQVNLDNYSFHLVQKLSKKRMKCVFYDRFESLIYYNFQIKFAFLSYALQITTDIVIQILSQNAAYQPITAIIAWNCFKN